MFSIILVSCHSTKPISDIEKKDSIASKSKEVHFTNTIDRSLAINDDFRFTFPTITTGATKVKDCDSLCNQRIKDALANVSTSKSSGNNSYKLYYDKYTNQLVLNAKIGETINQQLDSITILNKELFVAKSSVKEIPVKYIPTWIKYLAGFGALSIAFIAIKTVLFIQSKIPV